MEQPNYKLTIHPIGSLREIWALSWPLMLGLLSGSIMMFADRFLLARYTTASLNAAATSGMAFWVVLIIPIIITGFSEVFVGKYHGAGEEKNVAKPVWQMLWFSLFMTPIFYLGAIFLPSLFFYATPQGQLETEYFQTLLYYAPAFCSTIALMGFFIGIGQVKIITVSAILGNLVNIGLDLLLIFGYSPFPELGIKGAAIATGLSQLFQTFFLLSLFLTSSYRQKFGSSRWWFDWAELKEFLSVGLPAGLGRFLELIAHFLFFQIIAIAGSETLTILAIAQSVYILMSFLIEGLSKGVSSIVANLLGGEQDQLIHRVVRSAMKLQLIFASVFALTLFFFSKQFIQLFLPENLMTNEILATATLSLYWMGLFFLFDGFCWVYMGVLNAAEDTKFLLYVGIISNYLFYLLPTYLLFNYTSLGNAANGWLLIAFYSLVNLMIYMIRYASGAWKKSLRSTSSMLNLKSTSTTSAQLGTESVL